MSNPPFMDPYTCEHQVGEIRRAKLREIPGAVERTVWFRCAKCGATVEACDPIFPCHPEFEQYLAAAKAGGGDGR